MSLRPFSLSASERLKSKKEIETLFQSGEAFFLFPFKVFYRIQTRNLESSPANIGISIPKKIHRNAHQRNRIRRLMKEAYRLNKSVLYGPLNDRLLHMNLMVIYTHKEEMSYADTEKAVKRLLHKLNEKFNPGKITEE
ncbi:MAG: ribonuclease P protein component [Chitinophagaceae bacterium]|nr:ribonuclease P protein component [Chitinophagaceae bacterium]